MANGFIQDNIMFNADQFGFKKWCHQLFVRKVFGRNKRYRLIDRILSRQKQ